MIDRLTLEMTLERVCGEYGTMTDESRRLLAALVESVQLHDRPVEFDPEEYLDKGEPTTPIDALANLGPDGTSKPTEWYPECLLEPDDARFAQVFHAYNGTEIRVSAWTVFVTPPAGTGLFALNVDGGYQELEYREVGNDNA